MTTEEQLTALTGRVAELENRFDAMEEAARKETARTLERMEEGVKTAAERLVKMSGHIP
ncbi:TPA: hypothetical protein IGZ65_005285 [Escherichia coli]|nr:hypothetical protein [Escherichia coli]